MVDPSFRMSPGPVPRVAGGIVPKSQVQSTVRPKPRLISRSFLLAYGDSSSARRLIEELEADPVFRWLQQSGIIHRRIVHGAIPVTRRQLFSLEQAVLFVREHALDRQPDWNGALSDPLTAERISELALLWSVEPRALGGVLRTLRGSEKGKGREIELSGNETASLSISPAIFDEQDNVLARETAALQCRAFVRQYGLNEQEFIDYLLSGQFSPPQIAARFACPLSDAEAAYRDVRNWEVSESTSESIDTDIDESHLNIEQLAAEIAINTDGCLTVRFLPTALTPRYQMDQERFQSLVRAASWTVADESTRGLSSPPGAEDLRSAEEKMRAINERSGLMTDLIHLLCQQQESYLYDGDPAKLRPLSQAAAARAIGASGSAVSRIIRGVGVQTPIGRLSLRDLMPSVSRVVMALDDQFPEWSDGKIVAYLNNKYDMNLGRRSICYHRIGRRNRANTAIDGV